MAFVNEEAVGCGAIKKYDADTMEVKRMFTLPESRGKGIAKKVLTELETWASEMAFQKCILETGIKQLAAIALYQKRGYARIENYDQYVGVTNSVCFGKRVN